MRAGLGSAPRGLALVAGLLGMACGASHRPVVDGPSPTETDASAWPRVAAECLRTDFPTTYGRLEGTLVAPTCDAPTGRERELATLDYETGAAAIDVEGVYESVGFYDASTLWPDDLAERKSQVADAHQELARPLLDEMDARRRELEESVSKNACLRVATAKALFEAGAACATGVTRVARQAFRKGFLRGCLEVTDKSPKAIAACEDTSDSMFEARFRK